MTTNKETPRIGAGLAGPGRPKGVPNKTTALLKDAILKAATEAGLDPNKPEEDQDGLVAYLKDQATKNPGPFLSLIGKVLPMQVTGEDGGAVIVEIHRFANKSA